jgi:hypothetical protein
VNIEHRTPNVELRSEEEDGRLGDKERRNVSADEDVGTMDRASLRASAFHPRWANAFRLCYQFQSYSSSGGKGTGLPTAAAGCE